MYLCLYLNLYLCLYCSIHMFVQWNCDGFAIATSVSLPAMGGGSCTAPLIDASTHSSLRLHCCTLSPCVSLNIWLLRQIIISETRTPLIDASTHSLELSNSFSIFPSSSYFSTSAVSTVRSVPASSPLATAQFTHQTQADWFQSNEKSILTNVPHLTHFASLFVGFAILPNLFLQSLW